jgi:signal transduction histidine kinase
LSSELKLLTVEDCEDDALLLVETLRDAGWQPVWRRVETAEAMREVLEREAWDLVTADYHMPEFTAPEALQVLQQSGCDLPFLVVSGSIGEEQAVALMQAGAHDFFLKDRLARLPAAVERELRQAENRRHKRAAEEQVRRQAAELAAKNEELSRANEELASRNRELQLKAQQLYRSNAELERFAYVASHDLSEPLRSVAASAQLLIRRFREGMLTPEDGEELIGYIRDGAERMQRLIQALLTYSGVIHNTEQHFAPVDANEILAQTLHGLRQTITENQAEILAQPLPIVFADAVQLGQVLQNLIVNAIKYRRPDVPPRVRISAETRGSEVVFAVADNGIGIERQYWERIFLIFKRLHSERQYPGLGIGLSLAKQLIERHGGRMWVESEPDVGSTFYFTLPVLTAGEKRDGGNLMSLREKG